MIEKESSYWAPRRCLREPIPEIFMAAMLLDQAIGYHLAGQREEAAHLLRETDLPALRTFTEF
jgi:hypothetical protein